MADFVTSPFTGYSQPSVSDYYWEALSGNSQLNNFLGFPLPEESLCILLCDLFIAIETENSNALDISHECLS